MKSVATRFSALALAWALSTSAGADTLCLKDGRVFDGVRLERSADVVKIEFEHGTVTVPMSKVHACIIPGDADYEPQTEEEKEKIEKGFVFYEGKWVRPERRDRAIEKLVEEQKARVEEIKASRLWRNRGIEETKHFKFEYTVPQHIFERYRDMMEAYYEEFENTFKIKPPRGHEPLEISFYVDYDAFIQVTGVPRGVGGFFKFVRPYEMAIFYDRLDPIRTEQVIYHEVGHYLQKLIDVEFDYPHWPGESISEYYGASLWDEEKNRLKTGLVLEGRLSQIQLDIKDGEYVALRDLLLEAEERTYHDYNWGWSFVHFLMNDKRYRGKFPKFVLGLARDRKIDRYVYSIGRDRLKTITGKDMYDAFCRYMGLRSDEDLAELQNEWYDYIQNELHVTTSRGLQDSAWDAKLNGRKQRAKRLFSEAEAAGDMPALGFHRYAVTLKALDEDDDAHKKWRQAIALDPLEPEYYIALGESLLDEKDEEKKAEGKRLLQLAYEIDPGNFYLERNLERLLEK